MTIELELAKEYGQLCARAAIKASVARLLENQASIPGATDGEKGCIVLMLAFSLMGVKPDEVRAHLRKLGLDTPK